MSTKNTTQNNKSSRIKTRHLLVLLAIVALVTIIAITIVVIMRRDAEPIPLTDLAATYKGEIKDADNNLLVPFDVAYPEQFASGAVEYRKDALLLKLADGSSGKLTRDLKKCGFVSLELVVDTVNGKWYEAKIAEGEDVTVVIQRARSLDKVLMADFDYVIKTTDIVDESTGGESSVESINEKVLGNGQIKNQWYLKSSGIQDAWRELEKMGLEPGGSPAVVVAVIDTGVDYTHPDLKNNIWVNVNEIPDNGRDDDGNGYIDDYYGYDAVANRGSGMDVHGHGTHVAGIIAASNNDEGVVGIAYNAKIMPITAGQATGIFLQNDIAEAIIYAYEMGAEVINMSFGGTACSIAVQDALMTAYTRTTLVASAGNDGLPNEPMLEYGQKPNYPAALSYVIGVMSVNQSGRESSFTNWDAVEFNSIEYELYAPGEGIYSTLAGGGYGNMSGTSMAAPVVSGIAALLRSYFSDRDMYPSKFIQAQLSATSQNCAICIHTADHNVPMIVNAYDAMTKLPKPSVNLYDYYIFDGKELSDKNNGDGVADAGETLDIVVVLRNRWGMSKDSIVTIDALSAGGVANPYVEFLIDGVNYGSIGTYSTKSTLTYDKDNSINGYESPLRVKISEDCPNDYRIGINVTVTCKNALDEDDKNTYSTYTAYGISFDVRNGVILPSKIIEDMTLTKENLYIIPDATYIAKDVTVTVEPGTRIQFWSADSNDVYAKTAITYLTVEGAFICAGSEEESIELFPSNLMDKYRVEIVRTGNGRVDLSYTTVTNPYLDITSADHCTFRQNYVDYIYYRFLFSGVVESSYSKTLLFSETVTNSLIYKCGNADATSDSLMNLGGHFDTVAFVDSHISTYVHDYYKDYFSNSTFKYSPGATFANCAFIGNCMTGEDGGVGVSSLKFDAQETFTVTKIARDPQTGTIYLQLNPSVTTYVNRTEKDFKFARAFAQMLGGDLACVETIEEKGFMMSQNLSGMVGLINGSDTWVSGIPVRKDMPIDSGNCYAGYYYATARDEECMFNSWASHVLIEIPGNVTVTEEYWNKVIHDAIKEGDNNFYFTGNAVLNNFQDTNVEHWLRISAGSYQSGDGYMESIGLAGNWWGTTNEELIGLQILDFDDYQSLHDINFKNYLTTAPENTFPFVVDAYLLNKDGERVNRVSNETVTFVVEFNRDMDVTVPLRVRFGSSTPYAEYEIEGEYVSARRWEGTYTIQSTIENGRQRINIENGRAADDHYLQLFETDSCRFGFEIDTTGAQALIMQGHATENGIQLSWTQDEYDILFGYNVYRADNGTGEYQRLNSSVIHYDTKEFFDDSVDAVKVYDYYFTLVGTDLSESLPSGKVSVMSLDTIAPEISHTPVSTAIFGTNLMIRANVSDNVEVRDVKLFYRLIGDIEWRSATMSGLNGKYSGMISGDMISGVGVEYYIRAYDGISYAWTGSAEQPFRALINHDFGVWELQTAPTCTTFGKESRTCRNCGYIETRDVAVLGHTSSDWIVDAEPSIGVEGSQHKECTVCGTVLQTEAIEALPETETETETETEEETETATETVSKTETIIESESESESETEAESSSGCNGMISASVTVLALLGCFAVAWRPRKDN